LKLFTKIALGIAGFFASVAVICAVIAFASGFTWTDFQTMVRDGKFNIGPEDGLQIHLLGENDIDIDIDFGKKHHEDGTHYEVQEITGKCTKIDLEYGAGRLEIYYTNTTHITVEQDGVTGFSMEQEGDTLSIEGGLTVTGSSDASLIICIPEGMTFKEVDLEVGASVADIADLCADNISITVGAGQATISNIQADTMELEVGAGQAVVKNLLVEELDVEAGVGEVDIEIAGAEKDYNYNIECGIGDVNVGKKSYGGLGAEQTVSNPGATKQMDIECGIGKVIIKFIE